MKVAATFIIVVVSSFLGVCCFDFYLNAQTDPYHPNCVAAFRRLPLTTVGDLAFEFDVSGNIKPVGNDPTQLRRHFLSHAQEYEEYDRACFFPFICKDKADPIKCLKTTTVDYVKNTVGALFKETSPDVYEPYCTAFRIAADLIVTAAHCITAPMHFRLLDDPTTILKTYWRDSRSYVGVPNSDLQDYAVIRIDPSSVPFVLTKNDFSREVQPLQYIDLIAFSMPAYTLFRYSPNNWVQAVRFSRLQVSHIWPFVKSRVQSLEQINEKECLLHKAPTFPGMSGAPLFAVHRSRADPNVAQLTVIGIHIRNGPSHLPCGFWPEYNIGIKLPDAVLERVAEVVSAPK